MLLNLILSYSGNFIPAHDVSNNRVYIYIYYMHYYMHYWAPNTWLEVCGFDPLSQN